MEQTQLSHQAIQHRAYQIWQREGQPHGRDVDHWNLALRELEAEYDRPTTSHNARAAKSAEAPTKKATKRTRKTATSTSGRKPRKPKASN